MKLQGEVTPIDINSGQVAINFKGHQADLDAGIKFLKERRNIWKFAAEAKVDGKTVCSAEIMCVLLFVQEYHAHPHLYFDSISMPP